MFEKQEVFWGETDFWAPEVHAYKGRFFMFASFKADGVCRGTAVLVCDTPDGVFTVYNPRVTPAEWECLDGTLYVENGTPYMVFWHEWLQVKNGEVLAVEMTEDLTGTVGKPFLLWRAGDAPWVLPHVHAGENCYITDGPFLFKNADGALKSLWSSFSATGYVLATATADSGSIHGEWKIDDELIFEHDGGHGMLFETMDGRKMISLHRPNTHLNERPVFFEL